MRTPLMHLLLAHSGLHLLGRLPSSGRREWCAALQPLAPLLGRLHFRLSFGGRPLGPGSVMAECMLLWREQHDADRCPGSDDGLHRRERLDWLHRFSRCVLCRPCCCAPQPPHPSSLPHWTKPWFPRRRFLPRPMPWSIRLGTMKRSTPERWFEQRTRCCSQNEARRSRWGRTGNPRTVCAWVQRPGGSARTA